MTDHDIRILDDSQYRAAHTLFRGTLHHQAAPDDQWGFARESYEPGRTLGAFAGDELIGAAQSFPSRLAVPGGAVVPLSAVSRVGVRADWTRRGVLSALQRVQLRSFREAGDVAASLRASEGLIYGRYGYGVASRGRTLRVDRRRAVARSRPEGRVRLVAGEEGERIAREVFESVSPSRPGTTSRWRGWWAVSVSRALANDEGLRIAVRSGPGGDDGYVVNQVLPGVYEATEERPAMLTVHDLWGRGPGAWADLWLFLLGIDLVDVVVAPGRPLDEPVEWLLTDRRACRVVEEMDETWLRLVDVPRALAERTYREGREPVVIGVRDQYLPENGGAYRIGSGGAVRTDEAPELIMDVDLLGAAYLGDVSFGALAMAGRVDVVRESALRRADALFEAEQVPWSGTYF